MLKNLMIPSSILLLAVSAIPHFSALLVHGLFKSRSLECYIQNRNCLSSISRLAEGQIFVCNLRCHA